MAEDSPENEKGASHTTGAGETPAQQVVRSGSAKVPAEAYHLGEPKGGATESPAIVGTRDTGEPDETPEGG